MRQFTTPTITLTIDGLDLTGWHTETTLKQGDKVLKINDAPSTTTENGCQLTIALTQEETGLFDANAGIATQVRFINEAGFAGATDIRTLRIDPVLSGGVINYE